MTKDETNLLMGCYVDGKGDSSIQDWSMALCNNTEKSMNLQATQLSI